MTSGLLCPCSHAEPGVLGIIGELPRATHFAGIELKDPTLSTLARCERCTALIRLPTRSQAELDALYKQATDKEWTDRAVRQDHVLVVEFLHQTTHPKARLIEIGCGNGELLRQLHQSFVIDGIEPRHESALHIATSWNCTIYDSIRSVPPSSKFDVAILVDVIEHVADPLAFLKSIRNILSPEGRLLITTGNAEHWFARIGRNRWWYVSYPEHVTILSAQWFDANSDAAGFRVAHVRSFNRFRLSVAQRMIAFASALAFGLAPGLTGKVARVFRRAAGRTAERNAFGAGAVADHIFVTLTCTDRN